MLFSFLCETYKTTTLTEQPSVALKHNHQITNYIKLHLDETETFHLVVLKVTIITFLYYI